MLQVAGEIGNQAAPFPLLRGCHYPNRALTLGVPLLISALRQTEFFTRRRRELNLI